MNIIMQLLGRLHPLIVHLPIGFILLALLLSWYDRKDKALSNGIAISFLWGGITAVSACITGYLLYKTEGFAFDSIKMHLWVGIITATFCLITYVRIIGYAKLGVFNKIRLGAYFVVLFLLVSYTGHLGGSITHGEEYLVEPMPNSLKSILGIEIYGEKEILISEETWENTLLYDELIHPILNNKCLSCHSSKKAKGELILESPETILIGGEKGEVIVTNHPNKSSLYTKLVLPIGDDNRMPPAGKTQLTKNEIRLISEWISHGNSFDKSIKELGLEKQLFEPFFPRKISNNYPDVYVEEAQSQFIDSIETYNVHVEKINLDSPFLNVSCINQPEFNDKNLELLLPIAENIAILDLGGTTVTDAAFTVLKSLPNLTILKLDNTEIIGNQLKELANLAHLKSINLIGTQFDPSNLNIFLNFKTLEKVYLYNTKIKSGNTQAFKDQKIKIDFGNYELPALESDSILY